MSGATSGDAGTGRVVLHRAASGSCSRLAYRADGGGLFAGQFACARRCRGLALNVTGPMNWIGATDRFWYRKSVAGGNVFIVMNAATLEKSAAFDHDRLAKALGEKYTGLTLPFTEFTFLDDHAIQFVMTGSNWRCDLDNYSCRNTGPAQGLWARRAPAGR